MPPSWDAPIHKELCLVEEEIWSNIQSRQKLLTEISMHVIGAGGKRIRPGVTILSYRAVGGDDPTKVIGIAAAFEIIHSATLIHDDINDGGLTRRGTVSAFKRYGVQRALVAGDFLFVRGFRLGGSLDEWIVDLVADACTSMAESEILQSEYELNPDMPVEVYIEIIEGKTARPIRAGAMTGAVLADAEPAQIEAMGRYGLNLGLAFQIVDDILDVVGDQRKLGKPRGMDFMEGKPTLPLIMAVSNGFDTGRVRELFLRKEKEPKEIEEALEILSHSGVIAASREYAIKYAQKAVNALAPIPDSEYKRSLIELADAVITRDS